MQIHDPEKPEYPCVEGGGIHPLRLQSPAMETRDGRAAKRYECRLCERVFLWLEDNMILQVPDGECQDPEG